MNKTIGTIIHGALGDCYEQLCAIKLIRKVKPDDKWIGFFAVPERLKAFSHFDLDMLNEIHLCEKISDVPVDYFHQFQINDIDLRRDVLDKLPLTLKSKFDFSKNLKPWHVLRSHDFRKTGLELKLSEAGKIYLPECMALNNINPGIFGTKLSIGYLWRYREKHNIVKPYFQHPEEWVLKTKHDLFRRLIDEYNAHIFICGMAKRTDNFALIPDNSKTEHGLVEGEYLAKVTPSNLDLPAEHCTYLRGLGFAAEIEILAKCDLLLLMPSGFSEPLWMKQKQPVLLLDPPPMYMAKLWWNRMPLFDNHKPAYALYNLTKHTPDNVLNFLNKQNLLSSV